MLKDISGPPDVGAHLGTTLKWNGGQFLVAPLPGRPLRVNNFSRLALVHFPDISLSSRNPAIC